MNDILKQIIVGVFSAIIVDVLGEWSLSKTRSDGNRSARHVYTLRSVAIFIGIAVVLVWRWGIPGSASMDPAAASPVLQSVQAKPNYVHKDDRVTVTVQLDRPAPRGGLSVALNSSDPAVLTVDGIAMVPQGRTMGTAYSKAVEVPTYPSPVSIVASLNNVTVQTEVNITDAPVQHSKHSSSSSALSEQRVALASPPDVPRTTARSPVVAPAPLNPELLGRLEEAQGQLSAEQTYWGNVKQHMPAGTSLRSEISSQLSAAQAAAARCDKDRDSSDAASLTSCIDVLNDHLTQLRIQH